GGEAGARCRVCAVVQWQWSRIPLFTWRTAKNADDAQAQHDTPSRSPLDRGKLPVQFLTTTTVNPIERLGILPAATAYRRTLPLAAGFPRAVESLPTVGHFRMLIRLLVTHCHTPCCG